MSEIELVRSKNDMIRKKNVVIILQQIFLFIALAGYVFLAILSRLEPPKVAPDIDVLNRDTVTCSDGEKATLCVPDTITAGQPFTYETSGTKLVNNSSSIQFQLSCKIDGQEVINQVGSVPYSNIPKGHFNLHRTTTIPLLPGISSSDDCTFQSIATYTFYQVDNQGIQRSIDIKEVGTSNHFHLKVNNQQINKDDTRYVYNDYTTTVVSSAPANSPVTVDSKPNPTTSGGSSPQPNTSNPSTVSGIISTVTDTVNNLTKVRGN